MDPDAHHNARRRSPGWVRALPLSGVHGLALKLRRKFWEGESTSREDWLLEGVLSELEYRHRAALRRGPERPCCCELCLGPFFDEEPY